MGSKRSHQPAELGSLREDLRGSVGWLALALVLGLVFLGLGLYFLTPLVFGLFLYYGTRPIYKRVRKRGVSRPVAAALSLLSVGVPVVVVTSLVVVRALEEVVTMFEAGHLDVLEPYLDEQVLSLIRSLDQESMLGILTSPDVLSGIAGSWTAFSSLTFAVLGLVLSIFLAFTFSFFMFLWGPSTRQRFLAVFDDGEGVLREFVDSLDRDLSGVFFGNILHALATAAIGAVSFTVLAFLAPDGVTVPAPILLGLMTGIAGFVPILGCKLVYLPATALILFNAYAGDLGAAGYVFGMVFLAVAFVIVDTVPDLVLRPLISGRDVNQGALFISYVLGPTVFGVVGIFLLPVVVVTAINFNRIVLPGFQRREAGS